MQLSRATDFLVHINDKKRSRQQRPCVGALVCTDKEGGGASYLEN